MDGLTAHFDPSDRCVLMDEVDQTELAWASVSRWAAAWLDEQRSKRLGPAYDFISTACDDAAVGTVEALVVLADAAADDAEIALVGAGPLENLVSHSATGCECSTTLIVQLDRTLHSVPPWRTPGSGAMCQSKSETA